jgi:hypothetical protein
MENIEIYGFIGNMGVGKDYIGKLFIENKNDNKPFLIMAFADHFKIHAISFENLEFDKVYGQKDFQTRKRLQEIGTELGRDKYGDDIWCNVLNNWIKVYSLRGIKRFIITDVRFENEANFIKSLGGKIIKIEALDRNLKRLEQESNGDLQILEMLRNHRSEIFIKEYKNYDYLIDNSISNQNNIEKYIKEII